MSFILGGVTIKAPFHMEEDNATQYAQQRALSGAIGRDYFGSNKRVWTLDYTNTNKTDFNLINGVYQTYLTTNTAQTFVSTEGNYLVSSTPVHIDRGQRKFNVGGTDYISDFTLVLTEA